MSMSRDRADKIIDNFWWIIIFLFTMIVPTLMYIYGLAVIERFIHYEFPMICKIIVWILLARKCVLVLFGGIKNTDKNMTIIDKWLEKMENDRKNPKLPIFMIALIVLVALLILIFK